MRILALNCGSSSLKFQLFELEMKDGGITDERALARGDIERIGRDDAACRFSRIGGVEFSAVRAEKNHRDAVHTVLDWLREQEGLLQQGAPAVDMIGHRFVHGGERFREATPIVAELLPEFERLNRLAPLHNPHNLAGYHAAFQEFPGARHVAVFDTAFHRTIPPRAYFYGTPYAYYEKHGVRRYGFHGSSYQYIAERLPQLIERPPETIHAIAAHLGNGCSTCAIAGGRSMDSSMGFTPLEGLIMGTRCGDIDPALPLRLMEYESLSIEEMDRVLNKESGLLGISGVSHDLREVLARQADDPRARLAIDVFCWRIQKSIASFMPALDWRLDALVFTGGIGEKAQEIRARVVNGMRGLGAMLDAERNALACGDCETWITAEDSSIAAYVIPANEELIIARETARALTQF
ncbi:acetate kinase [Candidatus Sumerlaeota bacterium]|nr:acetate kinase [Candidatus Sumerlaeota bacterium]